MNKWECFCDKSYYDLWAVRPEGENRWGHCFHVRSLQEARGLCELLNELEEKAGKVKKITNKQSLMSQTNHNVRDIPYVPNAIKDRPYNLNPVISDGKRELK